MTKIMLVEDDNNLREIYEARLTAEGYEIIAAKDGEEALALAIKEKPDLVISDIMMPKISGFDMLDILRDSPETRNTKVIMMTALSQAEDKARAGKLGADRYLVKSQVTLEDVARVAKEVLDGKPSSPAATTATPAAPAVNNDAGLKVGETIATEAKAVSSQIKDFVEAPAAAPASTPAPAPAAPVTATTIPVSDAPAAPAPTPSDSSIAGKVVIQPPPTDTSAKDIHALAAEEEKKEVAAASAPKVIPITSDDDNSTDHPAPAVVTPPAADDKPAATSTDLNDPNNIAL